MRKASRLVTDRTGAETQASCLLTQEPLCVTVMSPTIDELAKTHDKSTCAAPQRQQQPIKPLRGPVSKSVAPVSNQKTVTVR